MQVPEPSSSTIRVETETLELKTLTDPKLNKIELTEEEKNDDDDDDDEDEEDDNNACWGRYGGNTRIKFPPPINFLVKSCSSSSSTYRRAWLWKKIRGDDHIVIRAMALNRHEYMVAEKEDGKLKIKVFEKDNYVRDCRRLMKLKKDQEQEMMSGVLRESS